jgi:hypothetical protein
MLGTVLGAILGVIAIIGSMYAGWRWYQTQHPFNTEFSFDDIHKGKPRFIQTLRIPVGQPVKVNVRVRVQKTTHFYEIAIRPVSRTYKLHFWGFWKWINVEQTHFFKILKLEDVTRQREIQNIEFTSFKDDICGYWLTYRRELSIPSGKHLSLVLEVQATEPSEGYIEFSNSPMEDSTHFNRRKVIAYKP